MNDEQIRKIISSELNRILVVLGIFCASMFLSCCFLTVLLSQWSMK